MQRRAMKEIVVCNGGQSLREEYRQAYDGEIAVQLGRSTTARIAKRGDARRTESEDDNREEEAECIEDV